MLHRVSVMKKNERIGADAVKRRINIAWSVSSCRIMQISGRIGAEAVKRGELWAQIVNLCQEGCGSWRITIEVIALHRDHVHSCWSWIGHMYRKYARQLEYVQSDPKMHMHYCVHARTPKISIMEGLDIDTDTDMYTDTDTAKAQTKIQTNTHTCARQQD